MNQRLLPGELCLRNPNTLREAESRVTGYDVVVSHFPEGTSEALARVLERELGLNPEQARARATALPQTVLAGATRRVADQAALRLLGAGAHVGVHPSSPPPPASPSSRPPPAVDAPNPQGRYVVGELETPSQPPRSLPPARALSMAPAPGAGSEPPPARPVSLPPSTPAGPRLLDDEFEDPTRAPLELDEHALANRSLLVRSERPAGWARRPSLPAPPRPSALGQLVAFTVKWGLIGAVVIVGWAWFRGPQAATAEPSLASTSVRAVQRFIAPARELTLKGLHVVSVTWPAAADGKVPHVRCLLLEAPAEPKLAVLRLGRDEVEAPASVQLELTDHAGALRAALNQAELELTPVCLSD